MMGLCKKEVEMEIINILLKALLGYLLLIVVMRFMGKREIGQLNLFDLIILLTIVDLLVIGIEHYEENFFIWISPVILLAILQKVIAIILLKLPILRNLIDGSEVVIINKGQLDLKNMKKINYNMDDLYNQLRQKDVRSVEQVEYAILETNGKLSVFLKRDQSKVFPLPLIISGKVNKEALRALDKDKEWLEKEVRKLGYQSIKKIYGANLVDGKIEIVRYVEK